LRAVIGLMRMAIVAVLTTGLLLARPQRACAADDYRELVRRALAAFDAKQWSEARGLFDAAHRIEPNARTLRGLGMVAFEMEDFVGAYRFLRDSLRDRRRPLEGALRAKTEQLLTRTRLLIGRVRLTLDPAHASVTLDGQPMATSEDIWLNIGLHQLTIEADGFQSRKLSLDIRDGDDKDLDVSLAPLALAVDTSRSTSPSGEAVAASLQPRHGQSDDEASLLGRWWFWAAAIGVVAAGVGATILIQQQSEAGREPPIEGTGGVVISTLSQR
jgi:hypothetical protein